MAKIMLVEDDNSLQEIYAARLQAEGHEIVGAKDGEEALAIAVKVRPEIIISDVMMPRISGFDMLDILRTTPETKDAKVIMMTALSQAEDKARADKLGADRYLVKSQVTLEDLVKTVADLAAQVGKPSAAPAGTNPSSASAQTTAPAGPAPTQPTTADLPVVAAPTQAMPAASTPIAVSTPTTTLAPEPTNSTQVSTTAPAQMAAPEPLIAPLSDSSSNAISSDVIASEPAPAAVAPAEPVTPEVTTTTATPEPVTPEPRPTPVAPASVSQATEAPAQPASVAEPETTGPIEVGVSEPPLVQTAPEPITAAPAGPAPEVDSLPPMQTPVQTASEEKALIDTQIAAATAGESQQAASPAAELAVTPEPAPLAVEPEQVAEAITPTMQMPATPENTPPNTEPSTQGMNAPVQMPMPPSNEQSDAPSGNAQTSAVNISMNTSPFKRVIQPLGGEISTKPNIMELAAKEGLLDATAPTTPPPVSMPAPIPSPTPTPTPAQAPAPASVDPNSIAL